MRGEVEHRIVDAAGTRIHLACLGAGPTVLMVHGFPEVTGGPMFWADQMGLVNDAVFDLAPHAEAAPGSWVAICPTGASA